MRTQQVIITLLSLAYSIHCGDVTGNEVSEGSSYGGGSESYYGPQQAIQSGISGSYYSGQDVSEYAAGQAPSDTVSTVNQQVPVPVPQPVQIPVNNPVPYPVPQPYPVNVPRAVEIPEPVPQRVEIPRPVPVTVTRQVPYPVPQPIQERVPYPVPYSVPQPYPVEVPQPIPVRVPQTIAIPQLQPIDIQGGGGTLQGGSSVYSDANGQTVSHTSTYHLAGAKSSSTIVLGPKHHY